MLSMYSIIYNNRVHLYLQNCMYMYIVYVCMYTCIESYDLHMGGYYPNKCTS